MKYRREEGVMDILDFITLPDSREAIKLAITASPSKCAVCSFVLYSNREGCHFEETHGCFSCPFVIRNMTISQRIRSLWVYANIHHEAINRFKRRETELIKATLYVIFDNITYGWESRSWIRFQLDQITSARMLFKLVETLVDICNEIEEEKSNGHI